MNIKRDIFYFGRKPNAHPNERFAESLDEAKRMSTTEHFWIINEFCDYRNFDWDWLFEDLPDEDKWAVGHNNIWPSQHQKDSGTWLCSNIIECFNIYRNDVEPVKRKNQKSERWKIFDKIREYEFDFSWHPDPTDPPFIYAWGCKYFPVEVKPIVEYHVPGATNYKYMHEIVELLPDYTNLKIHDDKISESFDLTFRPDPREPPFIYVWGNKYNPAEVKPTIEYTTPGATDKKFMSQFVDLLPQENVWKIYKRINKKTFDLCWRPPAFDPPYIYVWGNRYESAEMAPTLEYRVPGATQKKYMPEVVELEPLWECWKICKPIVKESFDFGWRPGPHEPPYIYTWGNKYIPAEIEATIEFIAPGATQRKYMPELVEVQPEPNRWVEIVPIDRELSIKKGFDFSWRPHPSEPPYIYTWGNKYVPAEIKPTLEYRVEGATERKYMPELVEVLPEKDRWKFIHPINKKSFDLSWRPHPNEPPYIYVFGNTQYDSKTMPTFEYHAPNATERKYMDDVAELAPRPDKFDIHEEVTDFDFSWVPNPTSPPYIYAWGNQWNKPQDKISVKYVVEGATEYFYMENPCRKLPDKKNFTELIPVDVFDYSWEPNPNDPPYTYIFGNKWNSAEVEPTVRYTTDKSDEIKYITDIIAITKPTKYWKNTQNIQSFDYSWRPHPNDPPFIYQFGTQWAKTDGPTYVMEGATETKYIPYPVAAIRPNRKNWEVPPNFDVSKFDFSWHPDSTSPPYIYQFGTYVDDVNLQDGPKYISPNNNGEVVLQDIKTVLQEKIIYPKYYIDTTLEDLIQQHKTEIFWAIRKNINYDEFDFNWEPTKENLFVVNAFGSSESEVTQTYFVNGPLYEKGFTQINFLESDKVLDDEYLTKLFVKPEMFYIDRGNKESAERFDALKEKFTNLQKTRFLNSWVETINRCVNKSETELCWILNSELDYTDFDFNYYPNPWQMKMVHVFGTQWNHWGNTYLVNKEKFPEDTKYVKIIEHLNSINFVKKQKAKATNCLYDILLIDYGNDKENTTENYLKNVTGKTVTKINYDKDILTTFKNFLENTLPRKEHFVWVCSTICNYEKFDFTYIPDPFSLEQLHVFPSDKQKYGDTFFLNVSHFRKVVDKLTNLTNLENINFNNSLKVSRLPCPVFVVEETQTEFVNYEFDFPYAIFVTKDNENIMMKDEEPISLWQADTKNVVCTTTGNTRVIVPKIAKDIVKDEIYDYPYIIKSSRLRQSKPLDIIFLSNNEIGSEENWQYLLTVTKGSANRIRRVDGISGRVKAYQACANESTTPWFFTVFAKLKVNHKFDWSWQPDRLQKPKHYIFYANNPVNGLEYGHQAMIAYNKNLTLNNNGVGLDFTLDNEHEVVELNSGTAHYNKDSFSTWRTAFRECLKLSDSVLLQDKERLNTWLTVANGDFSEFNIAGAKHAVEYYEEVNGNLEMLRLSYEWEWCRKKFESYYKK